MKTLVQLVLPQYCRLCLSKTQFGVSLCKGCETELHWINHACHGCAAPIDGTASLCGLCACASYHFDQTIAAFHYETPVNLWIKSLKFNRKITLAPLLALCLWKQIQRTERIKVDVLIPVPLHKKRQRHRGFNQAALIAKHLAKLSGIRVDNKIITRTKKTKEQSNLNVRQRKKNMMSAFKASHNQYKSVAIIDDVMTTGSTVNAMAKILKKSGVKKVSIWTVARA